jgi:large subunit ribosomal protein L29
MKMTEIRELAVAELEEKGQQLRTELFNLKFRKASGQLDNTAQIRNIRRDLARVVHSKNERQAQEAGASSEEN